MTRRILDLLRRAAAWPASKAISLFALVALDVTLRTGRKLRNESEAREGRKVDS